MVHAVKGFGIINKAEIDFFFWNSLAFSMIHWMLAIWSLVPLPFLNPAWTFGSSWFMSCWSLAWRIWSFYLTSVWDESNCAVVWWWNLNCVAGLLLIIWQLCKAISLRKSLLIVNKWVFKTLPYSFVILFSPPIFEFFFSYPFTDTLLTVLQIPKETYLIIKYFTLLGPVSVGFSSKGLI